MRKRHTLFTVILLSLLFTGCKVDKSEKPLMGGRYYASQEQQAQQEELERQQAEQEDADIRLLPAPLTDRDEQLLQRVAYQVSYNKALRLPNWCNGR